MKKVLLPLLVVCCMAPAAVFAAQQHPLLTDMAQTVEEKKFEAETAIEYTSNEEAGVKVKVFKLEETVSAGIIPKVDAFVKIPYLNAKAEFPGGDKTENGFGDLTIGAKWNFMNVDKTALAVKPFIVLPTGDDKKGLGAGKAGFGASLIASLELDKHMAIDGNLRLLHQGVEGGDAYNEFSGSVAGKLEATKELKAVCELIVSKSDEKLADGSTAKAQAYATLGAIYEATKNIDVDAGLRLGLTKESEDYAILAGVTFKF